jgi:beta-N-acetylhexosaminidase
MSGRRPVRVLLSSALAVTALACSACSGGSGEPTAAASTSRTPPPVSATTSPPAVTPTPTPTGPPTGQQCVQAVFGDLTASQKAGQLVMVGTPAGSPSSERSTVRLHHLGAVFLHGRTSRSPASLRASIGELPALETKNGRIGLLVATDQEGGEVQSLRGGSWTTIPSAVSQGTESTATLGARTRTWARELDRAGINMDLAPVADTVPPGFAAENPPIGVFRREYGSDPDQVGAAVRAVATALSAAGVIPTTKHFPGLGRVRYNTDTSTRAVDTQTTATSPYLKPYVDGAEAGAGAVMVSSATYTRIDPDHLAVFSTRIITGLLRDQLGWHGVVITDDLGQAVAVKSVPSGERATRFIAAGGDITLTVVPSRASAMVAAIQAEAKRSKTFSGQVDAAVLRVLTLKEQRGLLTCG